MMNHPDALPDFLHELQRRAAGDLRTDPYSRVLYSTDASMYQVLPYGVLLPKTGEDVQAAVELAAKYRVPILPRTAGSSLAGQSVNRALILDLSRHLDRIREVNVEERWVRVEPGVVLDDLNRHLQPLGLQFGPDPASSNRAAMGGIVANNATGSHSILYGMTADHLLETQVILSDGSRATFGPVDGPPLTRSGREGEIYRRIWELAQNHADTIRAGTPTHWRRCGGYNLDHFVEGTTFCYPRDPRFNLAKLLAGSEGTLAVMTEIKLNLVPRPTKTALALLHFAALYPALASVPAILQVEPAAVELIDNTILTLCREVPEYARLLATFIPPGQGQPHCLLVTEFYGESEAELKAKIERLKTHLGREKIKATLTPAITPGQQSNVWGVRKAGLGLLMSMKGDYKPLAFIEDCAVPVEHLADYVSRIEKFCRELGTQVVYHAHASAGCLHIRPLINTKIAPEVSKLPVIASFAAGLLNQYGGTFSSEHGDGRARSWLNERFFGPALYGLYKEVKQAFDPHNLLNPGNIVNAGPMTDNLRYGATYRTIPLQEQLDFSGDGGFGRAVELCNGAGVCRKLTAGVMCPSFMATREEEHSTRGRANALRAALSGLLPAKELTSHRMYEVMDLCIACKGCKAECPSSVDMAKIKFEFLGQYYRKHRVPLRAKLFADIAFWSHMSSGSTAPFINQALENRVLRWGLERFVGISRHRHLPPFAPEPFTHWFKHRHKSNPQPNRVVLFNDTFNTYNYPHVAIAATELLEAAGFEVLLPGHRCCGRPMISKGLLRRARRAADHTLSRLTPLAEQGLPIIGLEPSCLLSMRDEYFALLPGDPRVALVAKQCFTFEEFFAGLAAAGSLHLEFKGSPANLLLHGHCHQKALVGTGPSRQTLALPGHTVTELDAGCCGMAGAFGYEAEHYDISMAMAERRLLPAIRAQSPDTFIVAAGASCRQQIQHGAGRRAFHPAEILRATLG
jgi:FAD/FMN-containing dehydrogenase/Fe-S oxidoreductase